MFFVSKYEECRTVEENGPTIKVSKLYLTADEKIMEKTKDKIKINKNNTAPRT